MRQISRAALGSAALVMFGGLVPVAHAATVEVVGGTAVFTAAPGEVNDVRAGTIAAPPYSSRTLTIIDDGAPLNAGPGCAQQDANSVWCPEELSSPLPLVVWAGDRDDQVDVDDFAPRNVALHGQGGDDTMHAGSSIAASPVLDGGAGNDELSTSENGDGNPRLLGRSGDDVLTIDELGGGTAIGGDGDDRLVFNGSPIRTSIRLDGGFGKDTYTFGMPEFASMPGVMVTGPGVDTLDESSLAVSPWTALSFDMSSCPGCVERVIGSPNDDRISGDGNPQVIQGGDGNDVLDGGGGPDLIAGQAGDDTITSRDGSVDGVGCGEGIDAVVADRSDWLSRDCENIDRGIAPRG